MKRYEHWTEAEVRRMNVHRYDPISKLVKLFPDRTYKQISAARNRSKKGLLKFRAPAEKKRNRTRIIVQLEIPDFKHYRTTQEYVCGYL